MKIEVGLEIFLLFFKAHISLSEEISFDDCFYFQVSSLDLYRNLLLYWPVKCLDCVISVLKFWWYNPVNSFLFFLYFSVQNLIIIFLVFWFLGSFFRPSGWVWLLLVPLFLEDKRSVLAPWISKPFNGFNLLRVWCYGGNSWLIMFVNFWIGTKDLLFTLFCFILFSSLSLEKYCLIHKTKFLA